MVVPRTVAAPSPRAESQQPAVLSVPERFSSRADSIFFKTTMCKFYKSGKCTKGRRCCFAHSKVERHAFPDLGKTKMCPAVSLGGCEDPKCMYAHLRSELRKVDPEALRPEQITKNPTMTLSSWNLATAPRKASDSKSADNCSVDTSAPLSSQGSDMGDLSEQDVFVPIRKPLAQPMYLSLGQLGVKATMERPTSLLLPVAGDRFEL